ncbi:MAG: DUF882 domain-containing protein [Candidatus Methylomirabilales bacterium]
MNPIINRRGFLGVMKMAIYGIAAGLPVLRRAAKAAEFREKSLAFHSIHTGENLKVRYWVNGTYVPEALEKVNHILRDWRANEIHAIDPALLDLLFDLRRVVGTTAPFHVISGYRSPETNAMLRKKGGGGVASNSMHVRGKAIDVSLPGVDLARLHKAALAMKRGGVGYYPRLGFVHVDTGRVRRW